MGQARPGPERGDVVGGPVRVGPLEAVAGDQPVDQPRVGRGHRVEVHADPAQRAGTDIGDEHVGLVEQGPRARLPVLGREVEHDAAFTAVVHLERRTDVVPVLRADTQHPAEGAGGIAIGWFDLDDVGTPVREDAARRRTRHPHAEFDDPDALQRTRH